MELKRSDAIKLLENLKLGLPKKSRACMAAEMAIKSLQTDEAYNLLAEDASNVERVVRCKDCKYYHVSWDDCNPTHYYTDYWCEWVEPSENDYCSLGERKE